MTEERVGYLIKRVQQVLRARMDEVLLARGLTTPQYAVLLALEELSGSSNADLARRAFVAPQTMIRIVANLKRAGLIERTRHPQHGRILLNQLTERGRRLIGTCKKAVDDVEARMLAGLSVQEREKLGFLLKRCVNSLESHQEAN